MVQDAGHRDVRAERVRAAGGPPRRGHRHDRHRLVPRRPRRVVRAVDREDVALADADAPARRGRGHRDVPGDRARRLEVVGPGAEQQHGPVAARQREVGVQAARVQVAGDGDERRVVVGDPPVARELAAVGVDRLVGERVAPVHAGPADGVEDRVGLAAHRVDPVGVDRADVARGGRRRRHEVHVPRDPHPVGAGREVVDHVVEDPLVARPVAPAEAPRAAGSRSSPPRRPGRAAVDEPDRVVQVDDVDRRDLPVGAHEVRPEARDEAVDLRPLPRRVEPDDVLPGRDPDRAEAEVQMLDAVRARRLTLKLESRLRLRVRRRVGRAGERREGEQGQERQAEAHRAGGLGRGSSRRAGQATRASASSASPSPARATSAA